VVVACADRVESELLSEWLSQEQEPLAVRGLQGAIQQIQTRQAHLVVSDAGFALDDKFLAVCLGGGAPTPLIIVGDPGPAAEAAAQRHGAFFVARPVDRDLLMCSVAMAMADARPVRRSPRITVGRFEAVADGIQVALLDVANEGLRLEVPRGRRTALPPYFTVGVPLVGLSVAVQRIWVCAPGASVNAHSWCGGALADNAARQEQKWRSFVSMIPRAQ
jgi:hypothetical protein